ncbi:antibiotic biosynthesis monooxygenase family protein [Streptomyces sp. NPDC094472]|uniref:antibiotic biosynthesis monooxygenase family protein n=1 Tax=Streptomyces sp. NPDC094472 TaxID=3155080 RepID=UPI0033268F4E
MREPYFSIINIDVEKDKQAEYMEKWETAAAIMSAEPGFVRTHVFQALSDDAKYRLVQIAEWTSRSHWQAAMNVCPMMGQEIALVDDAGYGVIRTVGERTAENPATI